MGYGIKRFVQVKEDKGDISAPDCHGMSHNRFFWSKPPLSSCKSLSFHQVFQHYIIDVYFLQFTDGGPVVAGVVCID